MSAMVTFNGVQVPEADVLKAAAEIRQRTLNSFDPLNPFPVEPGVYRVSNATDSDPFNGGATHPWRRSADGSWAYFSKSPEEWVTVPAVSAYGADRDVARGFLVPLQPVEGVEYEGGDDYRRRWRDGAWEIYGGGTWIPSSHGKAFWRTGQLRPITPQPWTPKVGEWVQHTTEPWGKVRRVTDTIGKSVRVNGAFALQAINNLRPATPDEITDAKRIKPVDGLIVLQKSTATVWRYSDANKWVRLDNACEALPDFDLDHYDIIPEYTVQGVPR